MTQLTVSMPVHNTPTILLERAVDSVLSQTFSDLRLVLINDGGSSINLSIEDPRLVVYEMDKNRGRYFADAVVLGACDTDWFTIHDSDDTSAPNRFEHMFQANTANNPVIAETGWLKPADAQRTLQKYRNHPTHMEHFWFISTLYKTDLLKGLIHPGFRVGYDTVLCSMAPLIADVTISHPLLYKRYARQNSLTKSSATGIGSPFRQKEIVRLTKLFNQLKSKATLEDIKQVIQQDIPKNLLTELNFHSTELHKKIA